MRVITAPAGPAGFWSRRGWTSGPTAGAVKEALFNIIQFDIEGRRVLDLFAGTGQLGIEALSRGAASCVFTDSSRQAVGLVQENLRRCGLQGTVLLCDGLAYLRSGGQFDLVFIDPPYGTGLDSAAVEAIKAFDILSKGGIMICESRTETRLPDIPPSYGAVRAYRYGKIKLTVITRGTD